MKSKEQQREEYRKKQSVSLDPNRTVNKVKRLNGNIIVTISKGQNRQRNRKNQKPVKLLLGYNTGK